MILDLSVFRDVTYTRYQGQFRGNLMNLSFHRKYQNKPFSLSQIVLNFSVVPFPYYTAAAHFCYERAVSRADRVALSSIPVRSLFLLQQ